MSEQKDVGNAKWYCAGAKIQDLEKAVDLDSQIKMDLSSFQGFAKQIFTEDKDVLQGLWVNHGLVLPEGKQEISFFVESAHAKHDMKCTPVKDVHGLYAVVDVVDDGLEMLRSGENKIHYHIAIDARRFAKHFQLAEENVKPVSLALVDSSNRVLSTKKLAVEMEKTTNKGRLKPKGMRLLQDIENAL